MNKFLRIILFMYVVAACSDDNNTVQIVTENNFSLSVDSVEFKGRGGFRSITVEGENWYLYSIVVNDSVCYIDTEEWHTYKIGGKLSKTVNWLTVETEKDETFIFVEPNIEGYPRSFEIVFCNGGDCISLKGTQDVMLDGSGLTDKISPSSRAVKFDSKGGEFTITTENNYVKIIGVEIEGKYNPVNYNNWKDDTLDKQFNWLAVRHDSCVIELRTEENLTTVPREFKIDLMDGNFFTTIPGIQQAAVDIPPTDTIGFTPSKVHFPLEGGTVEVMARTDGWEIDEKSNGLDWLTIEQEGTRLRLTATPNFDYDIRHFTLRCKKGDYYEYLEGEQETR